MEIDQWIVRKCHFLFMKSTWNSVVSFRFSLMITFSMQGYDFYVRNHRKIFVLERKEERIGKLQNNSFVKLCAENVGLNEAIEQS